MLGTARKGTHVFVLTGEVHLRPEPVVIVSGGDLPKSRIAFILDYLGEGWVHVYSRGKIVSTDLNAGVYCPNPTESCRAGFLLPNRSKHEPVRWVKMRIGRGIEGWTRETDHFEGMDACG